MQVLILGGSGFIGKHLRAALEERGDRVVVASLREPENAAQAADGCDAIVNLAGSPVAKRWNDQVKRDIEASRTEAPRRLMEALAHRHSGTVKTYISASGIGYYGTSEVATFTETSPPGKDFLARVCIAWEAQAQQGRDLGMRVVCVRTALALGVDGGALEKLLTPFKMGAGGVIGSGKQWYSWIHIDDLVGIYLLALDHANLEGALNASAPHPVTNETFVHALGEAIHRPTVLPTPTFAIRAMLGEGAYVLLEGQRVLPERTESAGYAFAFPELKPAFASLLGNK